MTDTSKPFAETKFLKIKGRRMACIDKATFPPLCSCMVPRATAVGRHFGVVQVFALDGFMVCRPCFRMIFSEFAYLSERLSVISYTTS